MKPSVHRKNLDERYNCFSKTHNVINESDLIPELLIGVQVYHKKWATGKIHSIENGYVIVKFDSCEKQFQFPGAFNQYLKIVDEGTYKKLQNEYRNKEVIRKIEEREIERYVHFTNVENLDSILREGLLSIVQLRDKNIEYKNNDIDRWDDRLDANSLSITFPNYQMFYRYRHNNSDAKWVVISYDAKKVAKLDCGYFNQNAASKLYMHKKWDEFTSLNAFEMLFEGERENLGSFETTNPQAEVMVRDVIPIEYIKSIAFDDQTLLEEYKKKYPHIKMCYDKQYFQPRRDYDRWSKKDGK